MAGLLAAPQKTTPGAPGPAPANSAPRQGNADPNKAQALLILQPVRMLYSDQQAQKLVERAKASDPAKVLAAAAIAAVMASAKAAIGAGVKLTPEQIGAAVIEVIKAAAALLIAGGVVPPDQVAQVVNSAIALAQQQGEAQQGSQPPAVAGAAPGPGGVQPPGMAGQPPMGA